MSQLTLTLDDDLLQAAQSYARQHGQELEALVAELLKAAVLPETTAPAAPALAIERRLSIVQKLAGSVKVSADFDYKKALEEGLNEKYGA